MALLLDRVRAALRVAARVLGASSAAGFVYYVLWLALYKLRQSRRKLPWLPGPTPLPVLGSLHLVAGATGPDGNPLVHRGLMEIGKRYKGVFGLWLGSGYTVVLTKPQCAEEAFCTHELSSGFKARGDVTTDRASLQSHGGHHVPSMRIMTRDGQGIAMSTGAYWRKVRGRLVAHITSKRAAENSVHIIEQEVQSVVAGWRRKLARGERLDDMRSELKRESMNMGARALFSRRFGANPPQEFKDIVFCVEYFFQNLSAGNPSDMIPALRALPNKLLREMEKVAQLRDKVLGDIISEHRAQFNALRAQGKMASRADARDVVDSFFWDQDEGFEMRDEADGSTVHARLTDDQVHVCVWDVLFASTDTTAATNEWLIGWLINYPECQRKVHEELDRVVGASRLPNLADKEQLPYLWACLKETMRIRHISPVMAPHYAKEDMTLHDTDGKEFFVPRGAALFDHGYAMGLDPELWDDPEVFNPDRWFAPRNAGLDLYGQVKRPSSDDYRFQPFSIGPRMCPGYSFAKVAQFIQSATLLHCFRFRLTPDAMKLAPPGVLDGGKLSMQENWGLTIMPQRFGELGLITADVRPAARLARAQPGDIDFSRAVLRPAPGLKEDKKPRVTLTLAVKEPLSPDSALLRFRLPDPTAVLGLPVGKHFKLFMPNLRGSGGAPGMWNGREDAEGAKQEVFRAYTPTSCDEDQGFVDLVVKFYRPGDKARFPDGGKVSQQLDRLLVGDAVDIQGPFGRVEYLGRSQFKVGGGRVVTRGMVGMLAGGSGITPMLQVLQAALGDPEDETRFSLLYANQTEADILLRGRLEELAAAHPDRFRLHFTLDRPPPGWQFSEGFVDADMIEKHMPPPTAGEALVLMCGPPPMVKFACRENLSKLGYPKEDQIEF